MKRGDIVTVAMPGDFGKPRPALVIQADYFEKTATVTVLLVTSTCIDAPLLRLGIVPDDENGLAKPSQIMIDKVMTVKKERIGEIAGHANEKNDAGGLAPSDGISGDCGMTGRRCFPFFLRTRACMRELSAGIISACGGRFSLYYLCRA